MDVFRHAGENGKLCPGNFRPNQARNLRLCRIRGAEVANGRGGSTVRQDQVAAGFDLECHSAFGTEAISALVDVEQKPGHFGPTTRSPDRALPHRNALFNRVRHRRIQKHIEGLSQQLAGGRSGIVQRLLASGERGQFTRAGREQFCAFKRPRGKGGQGQSAQTKQDNAAKKGSGPRCHAQSLRRRG